MSSTSTVRALGAIVDKFADPDCNREGDECRSRREVLASSAGTQHARVTTTHTPCHSLPPDAGDLEDWFHEQDDERYVCMGGDSLLGPPPPLLVARTRPALSRGPLAHSTLPLLHSRSRTRPVPSWRPSPALPLLRSRSLTRPAPSWRPSPTLPLLRSHRSMHSQDTRQPEIKSSQQTTDP